jgi:PAS domain-containing protein
VTVAAELRGHTRATPPELSQVLDGLATCVLWLDREGTVLHLNEPAEDLFGVSRNSLGGTLRSRISCATTRSSNRSSSGHAPPRRHTRAASCTSPAMRARPSALST